MWTSIALQDLILWQFVKFDLRLSDQFAYTLSLAKGLVGCVGWQAAWKTTQNDCASTSSPVGLQSPAENGPTYRGPLSQ
jgi:hypothetical protein